MEPDYLMAKLENLKEIWTYHVYLDLDEEGIPILSGWYQREENGKKIDFEYKVCIADNILAQNLIWQKVK